MLNDRSLQEPIFVFRLIKLDKHYDEPVALPPASGFSHRGLPGFGYETYIDLLPSVQITIDVLA